jgi:hypothetical protein
MLEREMANKPAMTQQQGSTEYGQGSMQDLRISPNAGMSSTQTSQTKLFLSFTDQPRKLNSQKNAINKVAGTNTALAQVGRHTHARTLIHAPCTYTYTHHAHTRRIALQGV